MKNEIKISDFEFVLRGSGSYRVTYTSPVSGKSWATIINFMPLIDATKNSENPTKKDLNHLKTLCKA